MRIYCLKSVAAGLARRVQDFFCARIFRQADAARDLFQFRIVESIDEAKKRTPAHATDKIVALSDISIYTDDGKEVPLAEVFENTKKLYQGKEVDIHHKKASQNEIVEFFSKVLPQYDADRVHVSDMRKVLQWYNLLTKFGLNDFSLEEEKVNEDDKKEVKKEEAKKEEKKPADK